MIGKAAADDGHGCYVWARVGPPRHPGHAGRRQARRLTPADARALALDLQAAAERIDPQPPPRPDRGPRAAKGRR